MQQQKPAENSKITSWNHKLELELKEFEFKYDINLDFKKRMKMYAMKTN